jgi:hypothetical protein
MTAPSLCEVVKEESRGGVWQHCSVAGGLSWVCCPSFFDSEGVSENHTGTEHTELSLLKGFLGRGHSYGLG